MDVPPNEHETTLAFADIALGQIRALRQAASPRNFEIWYHYATGYNLALNQAINGLLEKKSSLSDTDLDHIYNTHIAASRVTERTDTIGARMLDEIKHVLTTIDAAAGSATDFSKNLAVTGEKLATANDGEALRAALEHMLHGAKVMELNNKKLEGRLAASRQEIEQLQESLQAVRTESLTDPLTTLSNRKFFDAELAKAIAEAKDTNEPLSLLMSDIDHFKKFNDTYGHITGDQVLRLVALSVKQNVKGQDIAARYGGEEFVIALPNTSLKSAITVADHVRRAVMTKELVKRSSGERLGRVTISIGAAVLHPNDTAASLIERADNCLYAAKRNGRNRVICEADPEASQPVAAVRVA
jgi:diguanylate cyclase